MRLILTLFALLFTQLFFNLAHAAPQARVAAEQRKSHANEARPDDRRKESGQSRQKSQSDGPREKTKTAKAKSEKSAKKIVSAKPKAKAQKTAKIKVTPPKKAIKKAMVATAKPVWPPPNWRVKKSR